MASKSHHLSSSRCNHRYQMKTENKSPELSNKKLFYSPSTKFHIKSSQKCKLKAKSPCKCKSNCKIKEKTSAKSYFNNFYNNRDFPSNYLDYAPEFPSVCCQHLPLVFNHNLPSSQYYNTWKPAEMDLESYPVNKKEPLKTAQTERLHTYIPSDYSQYRDFNNYMLNDNQRRQFVTVNKSQIIKNKPYSVSFGEHKFAQNHDHMMRINENKSRNQINPLIPIQSDDIQEKQREHSHVIPEIEHKQPELVIKQPEYEQLEEGEQNRAQKKQKKQKKKRQQIQIDIDNKKTMSEQILDQLFAEQSQDSQSEQSRQFNEHKRNNHHINNLSFESDQNKNKMQLKKQVEVNLVVNQNDPQIERERLIQKEKQIQRLREIQNYRQRELEYYKEKETQREIQKERQKQKQIQIQVQKQKYKQMQINILRERERERERQRERERDRQLQRQKQRQRQRQRLSQKERERQKERMRQAQKLRQIQIERERQRQINLRNSLSQTNDHSRSNQIIQTQKQKDTKKNESRLILQKWINNITDDRQFRKRIQQKCKQFNEIQVEFQDSSPVNLDSLMNSKDAYIKQSQNFLNKLNQIISQKSTSSIKQKSQMKSMNLPAPSPSPLRSNSFIKNQPSSGTFQQVLPYPPNIPNFQVPLNNHHLIPSQMIPHINPNTYAINNPINSKINQMNRTAIMPASMNRYFGQSESVLQFNQTHPQPQQVNQQIRYSRIQKK